MFNISHLNESCTKTPGFFPLEKPKPGKVGQDDDEPGTYLVDGAGFNDTNIEHELTN